MSLQTPPSNVPNLGQPSPKDQFMRASNMFGQTDAFKPMCSKTLWISVFFDGTNNNLLRDMKDNSHSNIVSMGSDSIDIARSGF